MKKVMALVGILALFGVLQSEFRGSAALAEDYLGEICFIPKGTASPGVARLGISQQGPGYLVLQGTFFNTTCLHGSNFFGGVRISGGEIVGSGSYSCQTEGARETGICEFVFDEKLDAAGWCIYQRYFSGQINQYKMDLTLEMVPCP